MDLTKYGLQIIKMANKQCDIVQKKKRRINNSTLQEDVLIQKFSNVDCRFQQKPVSKYAKVSQHERANEITGTFYIPAKINDSIPEINQQEDYINFEGNLYEIILIEKPSDLVYIKFYTKRDED